MVPERPLSSAARIDLGIAHQFEEGRLAHRTAHRKLKGGSRIGPRTGSSSSTPPNAANR
jgi:hypothetical protein